MNEISLGLGRRHESLLKSVQEMSRNDQCLGLLKKYEVPITSQVPDMRTEGIGEGAKF